MINEKLEKLNQEIAKGEARLRRAQHEEKILEHQVKQLTRRNGRNGSVPEELCWKVSF